MQQAAEAHPEIITKQVLQLLNHYGPSILDNSITDDTLKYLHTTLRTQAQVGQQFIERLLPYLNEKQIDLLIQRLIPIDVESCAERNALFRTKTILLYLMAAYARMHHFAADYLTRLTECKTDFDFFATLLAQPIPPVLACAFQATFRLIVKQKGEPLPANVLGTKLDEASESMRVKLNERRSHNEVYTAIDNIGLAELFIFSILKSAMTEAIMNLPETTQQLLMITKLNTWLNRKNVNYVNFCEQYYQKIQAVAYPADLVIKTTKQVNEDRQSLMLATQNVSFAALIASKVRITADGYFVRYNEILAAKKQREPLAKVDSNEAILEQKQGLKNVLDGYVTEVTAHPNGPTIRENLVYLKMTLTAFQRRVNNEGVYPDLESHHFIGDTFDQIVEIAKTATLSAEDRQQVEVVEMQIREMLVKDAGLSDSMSNDEVVTDQMQNL